MTPEQQVLAAAYLRELWPVCREIPRDVRAGWAAVASARNERLDDQREAPVTPATKAA